MNVQELNENIDISKRYIDEIISNNQGTFVATSDRKFLDDLFRNIEEKKRFGLVARDLTPLTPSIYKISGRDLEILTKILDHAAYFRENGEIRYKIGSFYLTGEEIKERLPKGDIQFISTDMRSMVVSILGQLGPEENPLSAKQVLVLEDVIGYIEKVRSEERLGVRHFVPQYPWSDPLVQTACRITNYALGKGRKNKSPSRDDIAKLANMVKTGELDFDELEMSLRDVAGEPDFENHYKEPFELLRTYLSSIDLEKYTMGEDWRIARPKVLAEE